MRYWGYLAAKLIAACGVLYGLLCLIQAPQYSEPDAPLYHAGEYLAVNVELMIWFLFGAGMLYLIVHDQRYRCRVCLRRLRMPVETGSRGFMLQMGRPRTEYICPYGHGTLKQEEFQTSGFENPTWTAHSGDMWDELYAASKKDAEEE
jgi:hypothetical protein